MINGNAERARAVASRMIKGGQRRAVAALSIAACLCAILLWQIGAARAGGPPVSAAAAALEGGAKIAFSRSTPTGSDIFVMNSDGTGAAKLTDGSRGNGEPAWSPDNSKIAFTSSRDGNFEVYVMNADGSNETNLTRNPLPDTSPAWSPDGTRIAFVGFVEGRGFQIHVMNADGSGRRILAGDTVVGRDPAWSPDGARIAFAGTHGGEAGVFVMNADGGGVRRLAAGFAPAWSPDGKQLAFAAHGWPSAAGETIRVVNADGTGERVLAVPPGPTTGPSWSPDGREVIYDAAGYALFRIEVDGCRAVTQVFGTSKLDQQPAWQWPASLPAPAPPATPCPAPASTPAPRPSDRVVFTSLRDGNHEIYVMNGDGTGQTNLTNNPAQDATPVWSPDGTRVAFTSNRAGLTTPEGYSNIFVMNADGGGVRQVTRNGDDFGPDVRLYDPAWSPDGTKIVFVSSFMGEQSQLVVVNADGSGGRTFISASEAADPAWSPDGTRIAYVGREGVNNPEDPIGVRYLFVVNADGSGKTRVADRPTPFSSFPYPPQASGPAWSPDGRRLAFASNQTGNDEIFVVGASGGPVEQLTDHPAQDLMPAWLPDGSGIAFTSYRDAQQRDVYVMSAAGGPAARLTTNPADDFDADWRGAQAPTRPAAESTVQLRWGLFRVREAGSGGDAVVVTRLGDLSREASVDFATRDLCAPTVACDGAARDRSDYARASGTLRFAPGEASKTVNLSVIDDALVEPDEFFVVTLSNAAGVSLGAQSEAQVIITSDDTNPAAQNPIDTSEFLVRMHYLDFLGREPEPTGLQAWLGVVARCPNVFNTDARSPSAGCDRIHVSSSFFRSPEFESMGYWAFLFYRVSLGRSPTYAEFVRDLQSISGQTAEEVAARKAAFTAAWVERAEFAERYREQTTPEAFVDRLLQTAGLTLGGEVTRDSLVADLRAGRKSRAEVVRAVAEHPGARAREFNAAFVTMQYFGYLKRDPEETGFNAWLKYLDANPDDFRTMIHGFLNSTEYRSRFGRP